MLRNIILFSRLATSIASLPHGYLDAMSNLLCIGSKFEIPTTHQATGLSLCCLKYGESSLASLFDEGTAVAIVRL